MATPNINGILRGRPVSSRFGAPMGRRSIQLTSELLVYLQQVQFVDGDYAPDGTYWGYTRGDYLWCAFTPDLAVEIYVRAPSRATAAAEVLERFPTVGLMKGVRA